MEKTYLPGVSTPVIRVDRAEGDLTIEGWNESRVLATYPEEPQVEETGESLTFTAPSDLELRVPFGATLEVGHGDADVSIREVRFGVAVSECGGDLRLRHCGGAVVGTVHGDLQIRDLVGNVKAEKISGDANLRHITGVVELSAGGDVRIEHPVSQARIEAGGDASVAIKPEAGSENRITAHGDVHCYLPVEASVKVNGLSGGDVAIHHSALPQDQTPAPADRSFQVTLGKGEAQLALSAGGDLWMGGWMDVDSWGEWRELGKDMGQLGMEFGMLAGEFGRWMERNLHDKFSEYDKRIRRKIDDKAGSARRWGAWETATQRPAPAADENDRLKILEMLQSGKISVDEAERLLAALEKAA